MHMKILFWILVILSLPFGLFMSVTSYFSHDIHSSYIILCLHQFLHISLQIFKSLYLLGSLLLNPVIRNLISHL